MKLSDRLKQEHAFIVAKFSYNPICDRCGATLDTFADACSADLTDPCQGFLTIDNAKSEFNRGYTPPQRKEQT